MPGPRSKYSPVDLTKVRRYPVLKRSNKVYIKAFGSPAGPGVDARGFLESLPKFLKASELNEFIALVVEARRKRRPFHLLLGAHTIKVGLSPIFIDLMNKGIVTGLSVGGAGLIHDLELAFFGGTSEDVQAGLTDGTFGMAKETGELFEAVAVLAEQEQIGLGEAAGRLINNEKAKNRRLSLFGAAQRLGLPATIHVGIGTDIVAQHPTFDAAKVGSASHRDFRILCSVCADIDRGGVLANIGSAVILPEVFLKALTVARNLNQGESRLTTANFDMIEHYRPRVNVVIRPTYKAGKGFSFVGHHEIMVPLLAWGLKAYSKR
jgi:hypothetical protein